MATMTVQPLGGAAAWRGDDLARTTDWIRPVSPTAVAELDAALAAVTRRGIPWREIRKEDFPLGDFGRTLAGVQRELEDGRGVVLLRGLPVGRYTEDQLRALYFGIGTHLGTPRYQNSRGELIGEVRDELRVYGEVQQPAMPGRAGDAPPTSRYKARSSGPLRFHTDRCDVVALLCVRQAREGGKSKVVSSVAIHDAMLARRPDLVALLLQDYHRSREGEEAGGESRTYTLPVWGIRDGRFTSQYSRTFVEAAQRLPGVPPLSAAQDEALDLLAELAEALCYEMTLVPGDLQLLNSHVTYHARTAYEDDAASKQDRLLYRLWLSMPNSRALPRGFEVLWGRIEAGALRGGIDQV
jgi:hypothetical protein